MPGVGMCPVASALPLRHTTVRYSIGGIKGHAFWNALKESGMRGTVESHGKRAPNRFGCGVVEILRSFTHPSSLQAKARASKADKKRMRSHPLRWSPHNSVPLFLSIRFYYGELGVMMTKYFRLLLFVFLFLASVSVASAQKNYDGIWKDSVPSINFYIQTYVTGSAVIIVTRDLTDFLVFLDQDFSDGISQISDLSGENQSLTITFESSNSGTAKMLYPSGSSETWKINKIFDGFQIQDRELGIFKPSDATMASVNQTINLYLQTYTVGSAVFIFTPDLRKWYVFLDPDWNGTDYSGTDLAGKGHHLSLDLTSEQTGSATITYSNGLTDKWEILKKFSAPYRELLISAQARSLPESTTNNLVSVSPDGTYTFSKSDEQLDALRAGNVIVGSPCSAAPDGFLRKVVSVDKTSTADGGQVLVHTIPATLSEVIEKGPLEASGTISSGDLASQVAGPYTLSGSGIDYKVQFSSLSQDALVGLPVEIEFSGITFTGDFTFDVDWYFYVELDLFSIAYASFKVVPSAISRLVCSATTGGTLAEGELSLLPNPIQLPTISVPIPPFPIPIIFVPKADLIFRYGSAITPLGLEAGIEYDLLNTTGIEYYDNEVHNVFNLDKELKHIYKHNLEIDRFYASAGIYPEIKVYLYDLIGPYFSLGPFLEITAEKEQDPWFKLLFGVGANIGISMEIFDKELLDIHWEHDIVKILVWSIDAEKPVIERFAINDDQGETTDRAVTLNNSATNGPTHCMASESSSFSGASWLTYSTAPSFTLGQGNGVKTVYFKVKNGAGESSVASDSINLISNIPNDGLVAYFPLDGNSDDASGNNNNGTEQGGVGYVAGKFGQAADFDGMDDKILIPHDSSIEFGAGSFSISLWLKTSVTGQNSRILEKDDSGNPTGLYRLIFIESRSDTSPIFQVQHSSNSTMAVGNRSVTDGAWHHVVGVRDAEAKELRLYIDKELVTVSESNIADTGNQAPLALGGSSKTSGSYFDGLIDDVRLYDRVLSESDIADLE